MTRLTPTLAPCGSRPSLGLSPGSSSTTSSGSRRRSVLLLGKHATSPLSNDALGGRVRVLDGGALAGDEPVQADGDAVDGLAGEGRVVVPQPEEVGKEQRREERVLEAVRVRQSKRDRIMMSLVSV